MMKLNDNSLVEISEMDLAAILTETFCAGYTPFADQHVVAVDQNDGSDVFTIRLVPKEPAA